MEVTLADNLRFLLAAVVLTLIVTYLAFRLGFYRFNPSPRTGPVSLNFWDVVFPFAVFLGIELVIAPTLIYIVLSIQAGYIIEANHLHFDTITYGWLTVFVILAAAFGILVYFLNINPLKRRMILWGDLVPGNYKKAVKDFLLGAVSWVLVYPIVMVLSQLIGVITHFFGPPPHIDQVAVKQLKTIIDYPLLFGTMAATVILLVPVAEEILFRGFLQRWMVQTFGWIPGIVTTATLFAMFHFSYSQKWNNVELILSLFILACFLSFLYERQKTLWAPIGLHVTFNAISVFMIVWERLFT